jgi:hypothetical protein
LPLRTAPRSAASSRLTMMWRKKAKVVMPRSAKRQRDQDRLEKLKQYGVDLADIPGLPVQIIPLQEYAVRQAVKFFQASSDVLVHPSRPQQEYVFTQQLTDTSPIHTHTRLNENIMEDIFGRVEAQQRMQHNNNSASTSNSYNDLHQAICTWLEAIQRFHRDANHGKTSQRSEPPVCIPVASFEQHYEVLMNRDGTQTTARRRAALHLGSQLLWKSSDCRHWFLESAKKLLDFIENITQSSASLGGRVSAVEANEWQLLQQESYMLLFELTNRGYHTLYPTLTVGLQRFLQQCPRVASTTDNDQPHMGNWRRNRDIALEHYQREDQKIKKLLQIAHRCFDILVPRFAEGATPHVTNLTEEDDIDDDDDCAIDWEDADSLPCVENERKGLAAHASAVERTLAMMQSTASLQDGGIAINLTTADSLQAFSPAVETVPDSIWNAKQDLIRCVTILMTRHLPRISAWLEGLTNADSLATSSKGSLVALGRVKLKQRADATQSLLNNKQAIAAVVASANKLGALPLDVNESYPQTQTAIPANRGAATLNRQNPAASRLRSKKKIRVKLR